jgi:hypothetical protein
LRSVAERGREHKYGGVRAAVHEVGASAAVYLATMQPWEVSGTTAEMTDYILLYRDSAPLHPWSGEAFDVSGEATAAR